MSAALKRTELRKDIARNVLSDRRYMTFHRPQLRILWHALMKLKRLEKARSAK